MKNPITVETTIDSPIEDIWQAWTESEHIKGWYHASEDWHVPSVTNDVRPGGKFNIRMEARDGSAGFDFCGTYAAVEESSRIDYVIEGGRKVRVDFERQDDGYYKVSETFEPENENSLELQRSGWQAILDNFKKYVRER